MERSESTSGTWTWLAAGIGACAICCAGPLLATLGLSGLIAGGSAWLTDSWLGLLGAAVFVGAVAVVWLRRYRPGRQGCCPEGVVCTHTPKVSQ